MERANQILDELGLAWDANREWRLLSDGNRFSVIMDTGNAGAADSRVGGGAVEGDRHGSDHEELLLPAERGALQDQPDAALRRLGRVQRALGGVRGIAAVLPPAASGLGKPVGQPVGAVVRLRRRRRHRAARRGQAQHRALGRDDRDPRPRREDPPGQGDSRLAGGQPVGDRDGGRGAAADAAQQQAAQLPGAGRPLLF